MLIDFILDGPIVKARLDSLLAKGWFRCTDFFLKAQMLCVDEQVASILNVRIPLKNFSYKKNHKKILRVVENNFQVKIEKINLTEEKEDLYQRFQKKFHGFIFYSLNDFIYGINDESICDTHEVTVYDGDRLIALSFFDPGKTSLAGLIGIYDLEYDQYSLGTYTMLKEIEYGIENKCRYYYPGHVFENNPCYDYKLTLGPTEYLNNKNKWVPVSGSIDANIYLQKILSATEDIEAELNRCGIPYIKKLNPYYAYGYFVHDEDQLIKSVIPILFEIEDRDIKLLLEYLYDTNEFVLSEIAEANSLPENNYQVIKEAQDISYYEKNNAYLRDLYVYNFRIAELTSIKELIKEYLIPELNRSNQ
ncbi:MAG: hypothetical protein GY754_21635 [bacterium]|nr:hypothetical protein [bacterium]